MLLRDEKTGMRLYMSVYEQQSLDSNQGSVYNLGVFRQGRQERQEEERRWQLWKELKCQPSPPKDRKQDIRGRGGKDSLPSPSFMVCETQAQGSIGAYLKVIQPVTEIPAFRNFLYLWRIKYYKAFRTFSTDYICTVQEKKCSYVQMSLISILLKYPERYLLSFK